MNPATPSILVVDDDQDICLNLSDILTDLGYQVDTAADGAAALERIRQRHYDVAVLDLMMPNMDGAELYAELKKVRAEIVALLVTAHPASPRAETALAAGVWQILPKPLEFPRLLGLVEEAVGQPLVLVVDDDADLCANLWDLLREHSYRVCLAHDVRNAVERLHSIPEFKVILLDMKLPGGDGSEVFREVQQCNPQPQVVVITGHPVELERRVRQVLAEGAHGVLNKPFDVAKLLTTVYRLAKANESGADEREGPK
jgi:DNA-binding NtrC family response regulator